MYGNASLWSPQQAQFLQNAQLANAQQKAQAAYQQGMLQFNNDQLAFNMAQQAYTDAISMGTAYGYAPGGNYFSYEPADRLHERVGLGRSVDGFGGTYQRDGVCG
jgi:hypothetical protein